MPPKSKKTNNPLAPVSKAKKELKKGKKNNLDEKELEDFIDDQILSDEDNQPKPKMKRLKKLRKNSSSEEEEQRFVKDKNSQLDQDWKSQDEEDFQEKQEQENQSEQFERYALADDDDIKADQQKKKKPKGRSSKKLQNNEKIEKFMDKSKKQTSKAGKKQSKSEVQLNIASMLFNNKKTNKPKRKDSLDDIEIDEEISDYSDNGYDQKNDKKAAKIEQEQLQQAIRNSKLEMQRQQELILKSIKQSKKKEEENVAQSKAKDQKNKNRPKSGGKKQKKVDEPNGPLSGLQIALTGQFQPYKKGRLIELIMQLGAKNAKSITKKATHLFQGAYIVDTYGRRTAQLPSQTKKSLDAVQKGVKIVQNNDLDNFFIEHVGKTMQQLIEKSVQTKMTDKFNLMDIQKTGSKVINQNNQVITEKKQQMLIDNKLISNHTLWTEKYKPNSLDEIIGQKSQIKQLCEWLQAWEDIHIHKNKRDVKASFNSFLPSGNINSNAALLSGDAGLGKTTAARLASMKYNYGVVQYNASSSRNKKSVLQISNGKNNFWLANQNAYAKTLIIMDQIDGMSSGDRGGITAIIDMIKNTKVPIICICNDRQSQKIRSLAGHCNDIKFHKPEKSAIIKRLSAILDNEGGTYTHKGLQRIVEMMQNDMRQIITYLEFFFKTVSRQISYDTIQKHPGEGKDNAIMINHFQASKRLMNRLYFDNMTISQRIQLAFIDSDFVPLMVHQNYLSTGVKKKLNRQEFHKVVKATQSFVMGDLIDRKIMRTQNYLPMPNKMFLTSVYPTQMCSQSCGYAKFTSWLGKFSSERKNRRLIRQLKYNLASQSLVSTKSVKNNYSAMMFQWIVNHLKGQEPKIAEILEFMDFYNINPTIINENIAVLQYGSRSEQLKGIPSSNKTKLTKAYNAHHQKLDKKKAKGKSVETLGTAKFDPVLGQIQNQIMEEEEDQQAEQKDSLAQEPVAQKGKKKMPAGKSKGKK